ncbi:LysR family transcriptional regulator [Tenggerimyces flavus]|uniref:LysR family transcriptional regulator n=1 Tax=Tenggerimyces flavus TaxID=1708749 RepID=A0ABV7YP62_9ACTN|nr:LysR family transcriptional regulator [Tenggerimyces flavus]MBM7784635.1 DNA-binding transcriptional LysR family regulator [Tenggerimyces flavus]
MELRQLRSFAVVAEELNVGRAATRLHLTQPSLSRQIAALERSVGVPLFTRVRRRFALTPAGAVLLAAAHEILRRADEAVNDAQRAHSGELGRLRIGFVQSATFEALPRVLRTVQADLPGVCVHVDAMPTDSQLEALTNGDLDVGLLRLPIAEPTIETRVVSRDPLVAALPAAHRLAGRKQLPLSALANEPFVMYTRAYGPSVPDAIIGYCLAAGFSPRIVQQAADVQTIVSLVAANLGVSLLVTPTPPTDEHTVVYRPLTDKLPPWELALAWSKRNESAALKRFLALATAS